MKRKKYAPSNQNTSRGSSVQSEWVNVASHSDHADDWPTPRERHSQISLYGARGGKKLTNVILLKSWTSFCPFWDSVLSLLKMILIGWRRSRTETFLSFCLITMVFYRDLFIFNLKRFVNSTRQILMVAPGEGRRSSSLGQLRGRGCSWKIAGRRAMEVSAALRPIRKQSVVHSNFIVYLSSALPAYLNNVTYKTLHILCSYKVYILNHQCKEGQSCRSSAHLKINGCHMVHL